MNDTGMRRRSLLGAAATTAVAASLPTSAATSPPRGRHHRRPAAHPARPHQDSRAAQVPGRHPLDRRRRHRRGGRRVPRRAGAVRATLEWPYRTALDLGARVCSTPDAVLREGQFGGVAGEAERITVQETPSATPAPRPAGPRGKRGRHLQPGSAGDVTVVDGDILRADPHDLPGMKISATIVGGDVEYDAGRLREGGRRRSYQDSATARRRTPARAVPPGRADPPRYRADRRAVRPSPRPGAPPHGRAARRRPGRR